MSCIAVTPVLMLQKPKKKKISLKKGNYDQKNALEMLGECHNKNEFTTEKNVRTKNALEITEKNLNLS